MNNTAGPKEASDSFIGVNECGCISAWMDRATATKRDVRDFYKRMADTGRMVQMANLADIREKLGVDCPHGAETR